MKTTFQKKITLAAPVVRKEVSKMEDKISWEEHNKGRHKLFQNS